MCDYSLQNVTSRPAKVGDKLVTKDFGTGTRGFADAGDPTDVAICVLPGTELAFDKPIDHYYGRMDGAQDHMMAIFRQVNKNEPNTHHDVIELPDGMQLLLTMLVPRQYATVLQLPAAPKTAEEAEEQRRVEFVG